MEVDGFKRALRELFIKSESRGKEAAGVAIATDRHVFVHKDSVSATRMIRTREYAQVLEQGYSRYFNSESDTLAAIGHARLVTNGLQGIDANNQPISRDGVIVVHNGIIVNVDQIWAEYPHLKARGEVDTEVIAAIIRSHLDDGQDVEAAISAAFQRIYGETSIAIFVSDRNALYLATNTGSIYYSTNGNSDGFLFASERPICEALVRGRSALAGFADGPVKQLPAGRVLTVDLSTLNAFEYALGAELSAPGISALLGFQRTIEDKATRLELARKSIRRCTKCLIPETMPFISYDENGVCSSCNHYRPPSKELSVADLEERFDRVRSKDGSPDCVVAFSGGRDSSYGLHLLKNIYRMNPITFSYDWGMVTDLARRNQARMCGSLGIEHLWISADIKAKRANIRANVSAWLKNPNLGLIPLFMAGDKQFLWYANKIMKEYSIPTMIFCANHYEKTDFKTGFLGIDNSEANVGKPGSASASSKTNLLLSYGMAFARNPRYINRSIFDTGWAYASYYLIKQPYLQIFDYHHWDEDEIENVLINDYRWEVAPDTRSTWRIGDGTAPFYNYIYATVAGFSEADTFRSAQVRAGVLTRDQALARVEEENRPRWDSIREYFGLINMDFDDAIRVVDRIPKLYI